MGHIEVEKNHFIKRANYFLDKIGKAKNDFDVEGHIQAILQLAQKSHERIHILNSESLRPY